MPEPVISFVLPYYKRFALMQRAWNYNHAYFSPDIEVVLVLDEPSEEKYVLDFVKANNKAQIRVIVNDNAHPWRPPCKAINVGIRHAIGKRIAVLSPETVINLPLPDYLQRAMVFLGDAVLMGQPWNCEGMMDCAVEAIPQQMRITETTSDPAAFGFGFVCAPKWAFEKVRGYDESRITWGDDDGDLRSRLFRMGLMGVLDANIKLFHPWHLDTQRTEAAVSRAKSPNVLVNDTNWGRDFSRMAWDWRHA